MSDGDNNKKVTTRSEPVVGKSLFDAPQTDGALTAIKIVGTFLGGIPLTAGLARTSFLQSFLTSIFRFGLNCFGSVAGTTPEALVVKGGQEEAMHLFLFAGAFNALLTYAVTPGLSIWGQAMCGKYSNKQPRGNREKLSGMGLRMFASHQNMMETFPLFALSTGAIAAFAPPKSTDDVLLTYTLLHVFLKAVVYAPAYIFDIDLLRSTSHVIAVGASISSLWNVMNRA